jgi:hypothetical protein
MQDNHMNHEACYPDEVARYDKHKRPDEKGNRDVPPRVLLARNVESALLFPTLCPTEIRDLLSRRYVAATNELG